MPWNVWTDPQGRVWAQPEGYADEDIAEGMGEDLIQELGDRATVQLVFDARGVTGHTPAARSVLQSVMWRNRKQIDRIYLLGGSTLVALASRMIASFLGVRIVPVGSEAELR